MVMTSLLQVFVMIASGALSRIVVLIKTVAPHDQVIQIMIVNVGFGTLLAAMGATPVSILPPIMLALGYSSFVAIALPALGYDALCTYALLGVPVVVFAGLVNLPVNECRRVLCASCPSSARASPSACCGWSESGAWSGRG
jgi:lactate permease